MKIFLDTSLLSDSYLLTISKELIDSQRLGNNVFYISTITHFQIMWGYLTAGLPPDKYMAFLNKIRVEVAPLTKTDAENAANFKPNRTDLLDALIASSVKRYNAIVWTRDKDFLKFLPEHKVRIFSGSGIRD